MALTDKQRNEFDEVLEEVLNGLPDDFHEMLEQVPLIVEDEPTVELQKEMGAYLEGEEADLMGVHSGPSLSSTLKGEVAESTPLIQIFRGPIFREANGNRKKLRKEIRITLIHEMGHHFDFSEEDLHDRGYG